MAFVDSDFWGESFANITQWVGQGRANVMDDVALVQVLLTLHFSVIKKRTTKIDTAWLKLGTFDWNTEQLIREFQGNFMKRRSPEGYTKKAVGNKKHIDRFTIVQLNIRATNVLAATRDPRSLLAYLRSFPLLAPSLTT